MSFTSNTVALHQWRVIETVTRDGTRSRHILGQESSNELGRASTAIISFDSATMTATTRSGRHYMLEGPPGNSNLGKGAWEKWLNDHQVVSETDVTKEYLQTCDQQGDTTITFTKLGRTARIS
jgi:hypothetical protein